MMRVGLCCVLGLLATLGACASSRPDRASEQASTIVVGGDVNHQAVHDFERASGRHVTREDLLTVHQVWIDNEILYREGLKLPPGKAEAPTREQVISNALRALEQGLEPSSATDDELRRWFADHRAKYDEPARFDFEDATPPGARSEAAVRALVEKLNASQAGAPANSRVFKGRPESNLVQSYGAEVASALAQASPGAWQALRASDGWRALRLVALTPLKRAAFETQRDAVRRDFTDAARAEKRAAAVLALRKQYKVEFSATYECHADK